MRLTIIAYKFVYDNVEDGWIEATKMVQKLESAQAKQKWTRLVHAAKDLHVVKRKF